jgi:MFS family permease
MARHRLASSGTGAAVDVIAWPVGDPNDNDRHGDEAFRRRRVKEIAALEGSLCARALWRFLVGTAIGGVAVGLVFRAGLIEIVRLVAPAHRAQAMSAFFAAAYLGLGLPVVLIGLISELIGTLDASAYVAGLLGAVILAAALIVERTFGRAIPAGQPLKNAHSTNAPPPRQPAAFTVTAVTDRKAS